jgi:hypothetical protein
MKKLFTLIAIVGFAVASLAQTPQKMSYQAIVRNTAGALVTNTTVGMKISILQGSAQGSAVFVETFGPTTDANGLVTLEIGTGTPVTGSFSGINWGSGTYFIKTATDISGGSTYSITGTSQLMSVPYALQAKTAESVIGGYNPWANFILVHEEFPHSNDTGSSANLGFFTRNLNTLKENEGTAFTFNPTGNSITINENGKYYIDASATIFDGGTNALFVENVVTNQLLLSGINNFANYSATHDVSEATVKGFITVTNAPVSIRLRHYNSNQNTVIGPGLSLSAGSGALPAVYSRCLIQKIKN